MKKHLAFLLATLMLICVLPTSMLSAAAATINSSVVKESISYVLMFMPNEAAYMAAVQADQALTIEAHRKNGAQMRLLQVTECGERGVARAAEGAVDGVFRVVHGEDHVTAGVGDDEVAEPAFRRPKRLYGAPEAAYIRLQRSTGLRFPVGDGALKGMCRKRLVEVGQLHDQGSFRSIGTI